MYRNFLSLRYLRARRTNWIGVSGIFVAVAALILILSIMSGFLEEGRRHLRGSLSDVMIQPLLDRRLPDGSRIPNDPDPLLEVVQESPYVESATPQMQWFGMLNFKGAGELGRDPVFGTLQMVSLVGIDPESEYATTGLREALEQAEDPVADIDDPFAPPPGYSPPGRTWPSIVIGQRLANNLQLTSGMEVEIVTSTVDAESGELGEPSNARFVIAGCFRSAENEMDSQQVYFDRRELADMIGGLGGRPYSYSHILVKLKDYERDKAAAVEALGRDLSRAGLLHPPDWFMRYRSVRTWEDARQVMLQAIQNEKVLLGIMLSLVLVVAGFTVFAILSMMVTEKRRDIGILTALGSTPRGILTLFLLIGFWEALVGASLGCVVGILGALNIDGIERWLSSTFGIQIFNRDVYIFDHIPSEIEVFGVSLIVLGAMASTLLFAAFPAWRAARLNPVDALRYE